MTPRHSNVRFAAAGSHVKVTTMSHLNIFRSLTSVDGLLGFYTKDTQHAIPDSPGCYAWFLPLWLYSTDLDELLRLVRGLLDYDRHQEKHTEVPFQWDSIALRLRHVATLNAGDKVRTTWKRVMADDRAKNILQDTLMKASLFMPPLYVGRTSNLRDRYLQHTSTRPNDRNDFRLRFRTWVDALELPLSVSDLLFVSVGTQSDLSQVLTDLAPDDAELLIEQILMQFCRPPFSLR